MLNHWLLIGLLSVSTYLSRILGVEIMAGREMSPSLRLYFNYVPVAIITALIIKQILVPVNGQLVISLPVLIGCLSTAMAIKIVKMFLPSIIIGGMAGLFARYLLG
ncbi:AzlD domain-containing protein [Desulforamulus ruminis]|uniref:AzlD domain-containing protein n=1 Tax=Desulforamulus ruminis TaxID=1564 RepID=UPI00235446D9|nr:AzlD domain-containing protein [Desulforamulus ruminis]